MSLITFVKETSFRLNASTPKYFMQLRLFLKWIAGCAAAIDVYANSHPFFITVIEKYHLYTACQWVIAASLCGILGASLPTDDKPEEPEKEAVEEKKVLLPVRFGPLPTYSPSYRPLTDPTPRIPSVTDAGTFMNHPGTLYGTLPSTTTGYVLTGVGDSTQGTTTASTTTDTSTTPSTTTL